MSLEAELSERLREAMKARDRRVMDVIRQIKTEVTQRRTAKGFDGEVDDALYRDVINTYAKRMKKALPMYEGDDERKREMREQLEFEVAYLEQFLPSKLDEDETRALIRETAVSHGLTRRKQLGRLMGELMRHHKEVLEPAMARRLAEEILPEG